MRIVLLLLGIAVLAGCRGVPIVPFI